jgi:hypothetical protein
MQAGSSSGDGSSSSGGNGNPWMSNGDRMLSSQVL